MQRWLLIVEWIPERSFCAVAAERRAIAMPVSAWVRALSADVDMRTRDSAIVDTMRQVGPDFHGTRRRP